MVFDPEIPVSGDSNEFGHSSDNPTEPVGPSQEESCPRADQIGCEILEALVIEVVHEQLAHGSHDEVEHGPDDEVGHDDAWSGSVDGFPGSEEQAGPDGATDCDQLDVTVVQIAVEVHLAVLLGM